MTRNLEPDRPAGNSTKYQDMPIRVEVSLGV
jgi:hypothetical protein